MDETVFFGLELSTVPGRVTTPRPASEQLVSAVLDRVGDRPAVVADVGTGSRCGGRGTGGGGAVRTGVGRVVVREGDLLEPVPGRLDVIVANLPICP